MKFVTTELEISSPFLPHAFSGFRIAQISDLHGTLFGENQKDLVERLEQEKPDLVVITGDLISRHEPHAMRMIDGMREIASRFPTYYIKGNHELDRDLNHPSDQEQFDQALDDAGVVLLKNRRISLWHEGAQIDLVGLQESLDDYLDQRAPDLPHYLGEKGDHYTILLAHNPLSFEAYRDWGADLVLSGHVHGGVIRLPWVGGLLSPERRFFPKYDKGIYTDGSQAMVVSAGMGGSVIPFRLFNPRELVIINLNSTSIH